MELHTIIENNILELLHQSSLPVPKEALLAEIKVWLAEYLAQQPAIVNCYSPSAFYSVGDRVFHASEKIFAWFVVEKVDYDTMNVRFDNGDRKCFMLGGNNPSYFNAPIDSISPDPVIFLEVALENLGNEVIQFGNLYTTCDHIQKISFNKVSNLAALEKYISLTNTVHPEENKMKHQELDRICRETKICSFFFVSRIENVESILERGLLAKNLVPAGYVSFANEEIQARRHRKVIDPKLGFTLHDYVPLYVAARPPFLYSFRDEQNKFVYIHINPKVLLRSGAMISNMNARSDKATISGEISALTSLRWDILRRSSWVGETQEETESNRLYRQAEIDVPLRINPMLFQEISVHDADALDFIEQVKNRVGISIKSAVNTNLYFN